MDVLGRITELVIFVITVIFGAGILWNKVDAIDKHLKEQDKRLDKIDDRLNVLSGKVGHRGQRSD